MRAGYSEGDARPIWDAVAVATRNLHWELLQETYSAASRPDGFTYRAKVPGGWLVAVWAGTDNDQGLGGGLTFLPDPTHGWDVATRELKE